MNRGERQAVRRVPGALLATLMLLLSVVVPVLERADLSLEPVAESAHDPGTCAPSHDHTLCTQVGANVALASGPVHQSGSANVSTAQALKGTETGRSSVWAEGHPARGPPHV
jgi:hypothetical protein